MFQICAFDIQRLPSDGLIHNEDDADGFECKYTNI